jgi:hypothetical protein
MVNEDRRGLDIRVWVRKRTGIQSAFHLVADQALLLGWVAFFQGRPPARGMTFTAGFVRCYALVQIISRKEGDLLAGRKIEKKEKDYCGDGDKEYVFFHGTLVTAHMVIPYCCHSRMFLSGIQVF